MEIVVILLIFLNKIVIDDVIGFVYDGLWLCQMIDILFLISIDSISVLIKISIKSDLNFFFKCISFFM